MLSFPSNYHLFQTCAISKNCACLLHEKHQRCWKTTFSDSHPTLSRQYLAAASKASSTYENIACPSLSETTPRCRAHPPKTYYQETQNLLYYTNNTTISITHYLFNHLFHYTTKSSRTLATSSPTDTHRQSGMMPREKAYREGTNDITINYPRYPYSKVR